jgi:hypothetical protein
MSGLKTEFMCDGGDRPVLVEAPISVQDELPVDGVIDEATTRKLLILVNESADD